MGKTQFIYKFGTMGSGKTSQLLVQLYQLKENNIKTMLMTSALDTRPKELGFVESRIGLKVKSNLSITEDMNLYETIKELDRDLKWILIDEAQFLTKKQVVELSNAVDDFNVNITAYGLKVDAFQEFFEGAKYLFLYTDKFVEIENFCSAPDCSELATMNVRISKKNRQPLHKGKQIQIGDDSVYKAVCRYHYKNYNNL